MRKMPTATEIAVELARENERLKIKLCNLTAENQRLKAELNNAKKAK